jgi:hypothetical protein
LDHWRSISKESALEVVMRWKLWWADGCGYIFWPVEWH